MTTKPEIPIEDAELEALMAELEQETAGAVVAPAAAPAPVVAAAPPPTPAPTAAPTPAPTAAPLPPKGVDPVEAEVSNFVVPESVKPVADPLPWQDDIVVDEPAPAPVAAAPAPTAAPKPAPAPAKPVLAVVPPAPAPAEAPFSSGTDNTPAPAAKPAAALQFGIDVAKFRDETKVSDTNLDSCMMEQSSLRAYYGEQAARAEAQADRLKMRFDVKEAELYDKHRKALSASGEKVTEKAVENAVKLDPQWAKMKNTVIEAETIAAVNKALVESLKDRRDMIIQLGADRRDEGKGAARILAQQDADANLRARATEAARR